MNVYVGQTRSRKLVAELTARGWGEITQPRELPPRRTPWIFDNGAFTAWRKGLPFDDRAYGAACLVAAAIDPPPAFVVVPDRVAAGADSLALSLAWAPRLRAIFSTAPLALVVQDGMSEAMLTPEITAPFGVIFVGGTPEWKWATARAWVRFAHARSLHCHIGRAGTALKVTRARAAGADSIDSCLPLWSADNLRQFSNGLMRMAQMSLF